VKSWLRNRSPMLYETLVKTRHSDAARYLASRPFYSLHRARQSRNGRYFAFDVCGACGMGAVLTHTVLLLKYAEQAGQVPVIAFTNPLYGSVPGADWFPNYFAMTPEYAIGESTRGCLNYLKVHHEFSAAGFGVPERISLVEANRVFSRYISVKREVWDVADSIAASLPNPRYDLSIHYRGTDKWLEATAASFDDVAAKIEALMQNGLKVQKVFLATDAIDFDRYIRNRFPSVQFFDFNVMPLEDGSTPRHFSTISGGDKAIEALVNILALSRSAVCIRTCSYLSAWSKILNPSMRTYTLNRLHKPQLFPEAGIAEAETAAFTPV
jgi:hypothetical protein